MQIKEKKIQKFKEFNMDKLKRRKMQRERVAKLMLWKFSSDEEEAA